MRLKAFLPTTNPARSLAFFRDTLGFTLLSQDNFALEFDAGACRLRITTVQNLTPQPFTVLGWDVTNIGQKIQDLMQKGVVFERYGFDQQDELGIWVAPGGTRVAWFKDPDGNVLSLSE
ncbi:MAG TPA: VOC family protein [Dinghuibacter sp.]|jgi:catechol 2,3-dioxygenase-like lactoylglutathione lyase family enzyme|uniref:VOC family protein n=1 Tax=Dinghuibacter sp. TaxID=2024697 RepID=UPI002BB6B661|nr:VOC family protein [Dinghuibacter sp.]HTJ12243.1 VOC family protein [Dinghuibacter sp.]